MIIKNVSFRINYQLKLFFKLKLIYRQFIHEKYTSNIFNF